MGSPHRRDALTLSAICALVLLAIALNRGGADFALSGLAYDPGARAFPLRHAFLLEVVLHDGARWLSVSLMSTALALWALSRRAHSAWAPWRGALAYLVVAAGASAALVALLKSGSSHSCPWDLAAFGGRHEFHALLDSPGHDPGPGRCLPSGHASVGFMWIAAPYARQFMPSSSRPPLAPLVAGVAAFGLAVSAAQVLRGAHFASHTVLTAATCWAVAWALSAGLRNLSQIKPAPGGDCNISG